MGCKGQGNSMRANSRREAFSLVELLVVLAIIGLLAAASIPMISSLLESSNLTRGGQIVADQFNLARQTSVARNAAVEVRFFKLQDAAAPMGYNAVQLWLTGTSGAEAFGRIQRLPQGTVISENASVSAALDLMGSGTMPSGNGISAGAEYVFFQVRPSGVLSPPVPLAQMQNAFLTVVGSRFGGDTTLPDNYVTIQINPLTATPLVYRP